MIWAKLVKEKWVRDLEKSFWKLYIGNATCRVGEETPQKTLNGQYSILHGTLWALKKHLWNEQIPPSGGKYQAFIKNDVFKIKKGYSQDVSIETDFWQNYKYINVYKRLEGMY